jgi:diguanylate cyclase (GGDEF)-like protein
VRVLLVDDSEDMRLLVGRALRGRGHAVTACASAEQAWEHLQRETFPLVLLDWLLPGMDGLALCRRIRALPDGDRATIVVITAQDRLEDLTAVLDAGANDYLSKPFTTGLLQVRLAVAERQVAETAARKRAEEALQHLALNDPLTGLPNRTLFQDRLDQAVRSAQRDGGGFALLLLDLDRFKQVNDTLGHHAGDLLLREVACRLAGAIRASDTAARLGGDEFAALLPGAAARVARRLAEAVARPFTLDGHSMGVGASIGIALHPDHGADGEALLRCADAAMYAAKRSRGGHRLAPPAAEQAAAPTPTERGDDGA